MATEALDRLHTTAESHHRVMVLEVMGRYAGWIALHSGIAGGSDCILIPEIPYNLDSVIKKIEARRKQGKKFSIVTVAEGAKPIGGDITISRIVKNSFEQIRLGGVGEKLARAIAELLRQGFWHIKHNGLGIMRLVNHCSHTQRVITRCAGCGFTAHFFITPYSLSLLLCDQGPAPQPLITPPSTGSGNHGFHSRLGASASLLRNRDIAMGRGLAGSAPGKNTVRQRQATDIA